MDDFLAGQSVRSGHLALAGPASAQRAAFLQQFFACSAVYGSVHAPASQQGTVRSVYYGIHLQSPTIIFIRSFMSRYAGFVAMLQK